MQQMLNNVLKVYVYGYVKDVSYNLDLVTASWNPDVDLDIIKNKTDEKIKENNREKKTKHNNNKSN